ncbi:hypothetical protein niasHT_032224 [Heterodera trifolii]|uniref:TIL domain-containing protein n=1 Tax=Heterodera trifolii TaxID=157864 RepID=A0ABD2HSF9_9BILA
MTAKETNQMMKETEEHKEKALNVYKQANNEIFNLEKKWEEEYEKKMGEETKQINEGLASIKKEMEKNKEIGLEHRNEIMVEMSQKFGNAKQQLENAFSEEKAEKQLNEAAQKGFEEAQQRFETAKQEKEKAEAALKKAEEKRKQLEAEVEKEKKRDETVTNTLMNIQAAEVRRENFGKEHHQKKGLREALETSIKEANEKRENLVQAIRKELIAVEVEDLVKKQETTKYQKNVNADLFRPLVDIRDKILYLAIKYFGIDKTENEGKCPMVEKSNSSNLKKRINDEFKKLVRTTSDKKQEKSSEMKKLVQKAMCVYASIEGAMQKSEKEKLNKMLNKEKEANENKENIQRIGEEVDQEVEAIRKELIEQQKVREYHIDQLLLDQQHAVADQQPQQQQLAVMEHGESSAIKEIVAVGEDGAGEKANQALITEQQQTENVQAQAEQNSNGKKKLHRRNTLKDIFEETKSDEHIVDQNLSSKRSDSIKGEAISQELTKETNKPENERSNSLRMKLCPENEEPGQKSCNGCEPSCDNPKPEICTTRFCDCSCDCVKGLFRDKAKKCVPKCPY